MRRWMLLLALVGCSNDPSYAPPPPEAVASCSLVATNGSRTEHNAYWFDAASRVIQIDGQGNESTTFAYDDQGRLVSQSTPSYTTTWMYEPGRVTLVTPGIGVYIYDLGPDGQAVHYEGPESAAPSDRRVVDYQYDTGGRITSVTDHIPPSQGTSSSIDTYVYTYDDQGRVASSMSSFEEQATTYLYSATPGQLVISLAGGGRHEMWTYKLDDAGRVIDAEVYNSVGFGPEAYSYSYAGDTITATPREVPAGNDESTVTATGACPAVATTFAPDKPFPRDYLHGSVRIALRLPNPPIDGFH